MKNSLIAAALLAALLCSCGPRPQKQLSDDALLDTVVFRYRYQEPEEETPSDGEDGGETVSPPTSGPGK